MSDTNRSDDYDGPTDPYKNPSRGSDLPRGGRDSTHRYDGPRPYDGPTGDVSISPARELTQTELDVIS